MPRKPRPTHVGRPAIQKSTNLFREPDSTIWGIAVQREHQARLHLPRACRPVHVGYRSLPELSVLLEDLGIDDRPSDPPKVAERAPEPQLDLRTQPPDALVKVPLEPTYWAGFDVQENPRFKTFFRTTNASPMPAPRTSIFAQTQSMAFRSGQLDSLGHENSGRILLPAAAPAAAETAGLSVTADFPQKQLEVTRMPPVFRLPNHMLSHPSTGQWLL